MEPTIVSKQLQTVLEKEATTTSTQVDPQLADKFQSMVANGKMAKPEVNTPDAGAFIEKAVKEQDKAFNDVSNDVVFMMQDANRMSMQELTAAAMQVQVETASLQVDLQTKLSVVTSTKDAVDTLMKNQ